MDRHNLVEIKAGQEGTGLLIEHDGYISSDCGNNKKLFESIGQEGMGEICPEHFIVSAVFQKYGIENANGRIYPENVLRREVERYLVKIQEKRAIGECYRPEAMILTESGWKHLYELTEDEKVITLNPNTNEIEIHPIDRIIKYRHTGKMIRIKGRNINDLVTPEHGFPIFDKENRFKKFVTASEIKDQSFSHYYIPKTGKWEGKNDKYFIIPRIKEEDLSENISKELRDKYSTDLVIPMDVFAKFMGIYLSEGACDKKGTKYRVCIFQKKQDICEEIEAMLDDWGIPYTINDKKDGAKAFVICDRRLCEYLRPFGLCYDKYVPTELKQQNKEILTLFYNWFVMGDGRVRGDKRKNKYMSDDVFSTSPKLIYDLNEIQLKIGYSGNFLREERDNDRLIEGRLIKGENAHPMYFSYKSLTKGIYLDRRFLEVTEEDYDGDVMCVEVPNHIWYVMDNNKCHWTKNCNHPSESVIDLSRVAINIIELHWEGCTLVGKLEIITSPGFRKYGIISCQGDQVANLLLQGIKIGVSSRGLGTVTQKMGTLYVSEDYECLCWDVVSDPSTPNAWITPENEIPQQYIENVKSTKSIVESTESKDLINKLSKFNDWLNE